MKRIVAATALATVGLFARPVLAADHFDGPAVTADPSTDITDVYVWMSPDGTKVNLVMDVFGNATAGAKFSDAANYVFHVRAMDAFGHTSAATETLVICQFATDQKATCWIGDKAIIVSQDVSATAGVASADGKAKVFAGLRDDPFFFNLKGFKAAAAFVHNSAGSLTFDAAGCPQLNASLVMAAVGILKSDGNGGAGSDFFAAGNGLSGNVLSIVITVDKSVLAPAGKPILGVWGSTNKKK